MNFQTEQGLMILLLSLSLPIYFACFWLVTRHLKPSTVASWYLYFGGRLLLSVACTGATFIAGLVTNQGWPKAEPPDGLFSLFVGLSIAILLGLLLGSASFAWEKHKEMKTKSK